MIFRNTFRLLLTNFSNVWKALLYYLICIFITFGVCWSIVSPIITKLSQANVFNDFFNLINSFIYKPTDTIVSLNQILETAWQILTSNIQFRFNYVFLVVWLVFIFPIMLSFATLPLGEVLYGFMTSQVRYGFTGRFVKNIGQSVLFSLVRYIVSIVLSVGIVALLVLMIKIATLGTFLYILLDVVLLAFVIALIAFKHTLFACFMPSIAVLALKPFSALKKNFKIVFRKFFDIFSNALSLVICAMVVNVIFGVFTLTVSLIITLPLTIFAFIVFDMVCYFSSQGMRFYVYPDMFISPKRFEEQDVIRKMKYLV